MRNCIVLPMFCSALLMGCGGGEETESTPVVSEPVSTVSDTDTTPASDTSSADNTNQQEDTQTQVSVTADLEVAPEFNLSASKRLEIALNLPEFTEERAFLNVCESDAEGKANYDACILQGPLVKGQYQAQLTLGNHVTALVAEI